ncbi:hypothetical protein NQ176_g3275 [Zarea fungicola]|uniref:Uncharacterized protein n=1 Tax=Zarea fungicola TaxID=93591 RepID=A0ACC1NKD4_9HYPO|nr:hypothetical protein NQ176_g3275 [Lecanicillium fungicola]
MHFQITVFLTSVAVATAVTPCNGARDHIEVADNMINSANPPYVNTHTKQTFCKYATSVSDATEEEMNALEFTSSYAADNLGNTWLVSEELLPVVQITKAYMDQFAVDLPTDIIGDEHYVFNATYFDERLKRVRADPELLQQAHAWVVDAKRRLLDPSLKVKRELESRTYYRCRPNRCQSQRTCVQWERWCNACYQFSCNYYVGGIIDGC